MFDFGRDYAYQNELHGLEGRPRSGLALPSAPPAAAAAAGAAPHYGPQWVLLVFHHPVTAPQARPRAALLSYRHAHHARCVAFAQRARWLEARCVHTQHRIVQLTAHRLCACIRVRSWALARPHPLQASGRPLAERVRDGPVVRVPHPREDCLANVQESRSRLPHTLGSGHQAEEHRLRTA